MLLAASGPAGASTSTSATTVAGPGSTRNTTGSWPPPSRTTASTRASACPLRAQGVAQGPRRLRHRLVAQRFPRTQVEEAQELGGARRLHRHHRGRVRPA